MTDALDDHLREHHVIPLVPGVSCKPCGKCSGAGWCWGYERDDPDESTVADTMTQYTCDWCDGNGKACVR